MSSETRSQIHEFITTRYPKVSIGDDEDIFSLGFVNSLFAMELVMFIEKTFGLAIPNDELKIDNFRTVDSMAELIERQATVSSGSR